MSRNKGTEVPSFTFEDVLIEEPDVLPKLRGYDSPSRLALLLHRLSPQYRIVKVHDIATSQMGIEDLVRMRPDLAANSAAGRAALLGLGFANASEARMPTEPVLHDSN